MSSVSRREILRLFKSLHRARQLAFQDDIETLSGVRSAINDYFQNNKSESDKEKIKKLYDDAVKIEDEFRTQIIQAVEVKPGYYKINIRPEHCVDDPPRLYSKNRFKNNECEQTKENERHH